jgi:hypothetical protein
MRHEQNDETSHLGGLVRGDVLGDLPSTGMARCSFLVVGGAISVIATVFINRKVRRDEQLAQFRNQTDHFNARGDERNPEK